MISKWQTKEKQSNRSYPHSAFYPFAQRIVDRYIVSLGPSSSFCSIWTEMKMVLSCKQWFSWILVLKGKTSVSAGAWIVVSEVEMVSEAPQYVEWLEALPAASQIDLWPGQRDRRPWSTEGQQKATYPGVLDHRLLLWDLLTDCCFENLLPQLRWSLQGSVQAQGQLRGQDVGCVLPWPKPAQRLLMSTDSHYTGPELCQKIRLHMRSWMGDHAALQFT